MGDDFLPREGNATQEYKYDLASAMGFSALLE